MMTSTRPSPLHTALVALLVALTLSLACGQAEESAELVSAQPTAAPTTPSPTFTPIPPSPTPQPSPTATPVPPTPTPRKLEPTVTATPAPTPVTIRRPSSAFPAIEFQIETFAGETLALSDLEGQVVVLNFWASWCPPCRWEMPFFEEISQEYSGQDVTFFGVAVSDTLENAAGFANMVGVTYPNGLDASGRIGREYEVRSLPTTFLIDREGVVQRRVANAVPEAILRIFIDGQLKSPPGAKPEVLN